jgi:hypothetical protein
MTSPLQPADGVYAFSRLTTVTIPAQIKILHNRCFFQCRTLEHLQFDPYSQLQEIGNECFRGCGIKEIYFPDSLDRIGAEAFAECLVLRYLHFGTDSRLASVEAAAFDMTGVRPTMIPRSVRFIGSCAFPIAQFRWNYMAAVSYHDAMYDYDNRYRGMDLRFSELPARL